MRDRLVLLLPILIVVLAALFFLFTMSVSIFLILVVFTSGIFREYAANSMWIALIPPSVITILFLQKVLGRIYDISYVSTTHSKADINTNSSQRQGE